MKNMIPLFLVISCSPVSLAEPQSPSRNRPGLSLRETFEVYVRSVQTSDLEGLFSTVTNDEHLLFLTADGRKISSRAGYYDFHEKWFREKEWSMPVEPLELHEGGDYGWVTATFHYRRNAPTASRYDTDHLDSYFTLIFRKEEGMWKVVADVCTPISRGLTAAGGQVHLTSEQRYLLEVIAERRTVREFKPDPVPEAHLLSILDAARMAPTAGNQQPWRFLVIRDRDTLDRLREQALRWYLEGRPNDERASLREHVGQVLQNVMSAPVYVAILVDSEARHPEYVLYDGTLAAGTLMIAARALGYGTGFFTTFFPEEQMRAFFDIPERYRLICFTPIGRPAKWPATPPKKTLEELVHFETLGQ